MEAVIEAMFSIRAFMVARQWSTLALARLLWVAQRLVSGRVEADGDSVLIVARNRLALSYAKVLGASLTNSAGGPLLVTGPRSMYRALRSLESEGPTYRFVPLTRAIFGRWRLIVFPHHFAGALFRPEVPKVFVGHGLYTGKIIGNDNYVYGIKSLIAPGRCVYTKMLASSPLEQRDAERVDPVFSQVITLTGEVLAADLLRRNQRRESIRAELGLSPGDKAVLFMSTWGSRSLFGAGPDELEAVALALAKRYTVFLTVHPRHLCPATARRLDALRALNVKIVLESDAWLDAAVAADVAVADITSTALYFALLTKPVIFVGELGKARLDRHSPLVSLRECMPRIKELNELPALIDGIARAGIDARTQKLVDSFFPFVCNQDDVVEKIVGTALPQTLEAGVKRGAIALLGGSLTFGKSDPDAGS